MGGGGGVEVLEIRESVCDFVSDTGGGTSFSLCFARVYYQSTMAQSYLSH